MPQKPASELKTLDYFAGDWKCEATVIGASGKLSTYISISHAEWMLGGFFLIEHWEFELDGEKGKELSIKGYDPARKVYTYHAFTSHGEAFYDKGTVDSDVWTWLRDEVRDGKITKSRYTIRITSPVSYTFQFETSADGKNWTTVMTVSAKKG